MNKQELVEKVAARSGLTKKVTDQVLKALTEEIMDTVASGGKVTLVGFGSFEPVQRASRSGRNPQTGQEMVIPERTLPKFVPGKVFKASVGN